LLKQSHCRSPALPVICAGTGKSGQEKGGRVSFYNTGTAMRYEGNNGLRTEGPTTSCPERCDAPSLPRCRRNENPTTIPPLYASLFSWFSLRCAHVVIVFVAGTGSTVVANNHDNPTTTTTSALQNRVAAAPCGGQDGRRDAFSINIPPLRGEGFTM
jgi:hypothetical protein